MSQKVAIEFPNSLKDWHLYSPEDLEPSTPTHMVSLIPRSEIIKHQNKLQKFLQIWKKKFESLFPVSFMITGFQSEQVAYQDYSSKNSNYVIYQLKEADHFFTLQIDSVLAKYLINQSFGVNEDSSIDIAYTELEQIVFKQFFKDTFLDSLRKCNLATNKCEFDTDYGKKEKNGLIHNLDGYYVFDFSLLISSHDEPCHIVFAFTKDNLEIFFDRIIFKQNFQQIVLSPTIKKEMYTTVEVKFGEVNLTLGDLQSIQSGDVLLLKKPVGDLVDAVIGEELKFTAECGLNKNVLAIKLIEQINSDEVADILPQLESEDGDDELIDAFDEDIEEDEENEFESVLDEKSTGDDLTDSDDEDDYDWENL